MVRFSKNVINVAENKEYSTRQKNGPLWDLNGFKQSHSSGNWLNLNFYLCNFPVAQKLWILHLFFLFKSAGKL